MYGFVNCSRELLIKLRFTLNWKCCKNEKQCPKSDLKWLISCVWDSNLELKTNSWPKLLNFDGCKQFSMTWIPKIAFKRQTKNATDSNPILHQRNLRKPAIKSNHLWKKTRKIDFSESAKTTSKTYSDITCSRKKKKSWEIPRIPCQTNYHKI